MRPCVCVCVCVCMRACVHACVCAPAALCGLGAFVRRPPAALSGLARPGLEPRGCPRRVPAAGPPGKPLPSSLPPCLRAPLFLPGARAPSPLASAGSPALALLSSPAGGGPALGFPALGFPALGFAASRARSFGTQTPTRTLAVLSCAAEAGAAEPRTEALPAAPPAGRSVGCCAVAGRAAFRACRDRPVGSGNPAPREPRTGPDARTDGQSRTEREPCGFRGASWTRLSPALPTHARGCLLHRFSPLPGGREVLERTVDSESSGGKLRTASGSFLILPTLSRFSPVGNVPLTLERDVLHRWC